MLNGTNLNPPYHSVSCPFRRTPVSAHLELLSPNSQHDIHAFRDHEATTQLSQKPIPKIKPVPDSTISCILQAARESALETEQISTRYREAQIPAMTEASGTAIVVPSKEYELRL
jgi:hypothetical protein